MPKLFTTFSEQIRFLEDEKHLVISDHQYAEEKLKRIGYFPLIGGYKHLFRVPLTKKYKAGTTFDEIVALYDFDSELRELFFKYLLQIERHLRSLMSYYFSEKYGELQSAYLDIHSYDNNPRNNKIIVRLLATLQRAVTTTDYAYINYYRTTYENIPLWVLVNVLTFGNLSKMYKVFPQSLRSKICKNFQVINQRQLEQFLSVLTKFRNVCAHGERLFTYRTIDNISDLPLHQNLSIPQNGIQYKYGKNDLFAVVISFRYLLPEEDFSDFKKNLSFEISKANKKMVHITEPELLVHMGFPPNWEDISFCPITHSIKEY